MIAHEIGHGFGKTKENRRAVGTNKVSDLGIFFAQVQTTIVMPGTANVRDQGVTAVLLVLLLVMLVVLLS